MTTSDDGDADDDVAGEGEAFRYNKINSQEPNARDASVFSLSSSFSRWANMCNAPPRRNSCFIAGDSLWLERYGHHLLSSAISLVKAVCKRYGTMAAGDFSLSVIGEGKGEACAQPVIEISATGNSLEEDA